MNEETEQLLLDEFRAFRSEVTSWRQDIGERVATLETQVKDVYGNGKPGRLDEAEKRLNTHSRIMWIGLGAYTMVQFVAVIAMHWIFKQ